MTLSVCVLTQSGLSLLQRYGMSLNCINMPLRLTMTTAPSTDCYNNGSKVRFQVTTPKTCVGRVSGRDNIYLWEWIQEESNGQCDNHHNESRE